LMGAEGGGSSTCLGFRCLETTIKSGNKTCRSYSSTIVATLSQPTYSTRHCNPLNLGLSLKTHISCVVVSLKVITKARKDSKTLITSSTILTYIISNFVSNSPHTMEGLVMYELNNLCAS
jgi:hypothetical protein